MPTGASAQQFLHIETIREDVVVLKDGGLRAVLMCSSLNFALKSPEEQSAIVFAYQDFLNSLDFPLQFIIHSRKFNVAPYLESLKTRQKEEYNDLLKIQINEYIEFINTFVGMTNVMSKTFYTAVPFTPPALQEKKLLETFLWSFGLGGKKEEPAGNADSFTERKNQLWQRTDTIIEGLRRLGIRAAPLNTEELIELFYGLYNPTEFETATVSLKTP